MTRPNQTTEAQESDLQDPRADLPPDRRSRVALGLVRGAALGRLELQRCAGCGAIQYPPREACVRCLSEELEWTLMSGEGELVSETTLHHSQELFFRERTPWRLGLVRLAEGVSLVVHLDARCGPAPSPVTVEATLDRAGQAALVAKPAGRDTSLADDPKLRDMTSRSALPQSAGHRRQVAGRASRRESGARGRRRSGLGRPLRALEESAGLGLDRRRCRRRRWCRSTSPTPNPSTNSPPNSASRSTS